VTPHDADFGPTEGYRHPDPVADAALDWFVRMQDVPDEAAIAALGDWLRADPRHAAAYRQLEATWASPEMQLATERLAIRLDAAPGRSRTPPRRRIGWAAAALVAVIGLGIAAYPSLSLYIGSDYMTGTGERRDVTLPDGSHMVLNTASAVAIDFAEGRRSVTLLKGEAYFDVVHDAVHPFEVMASFGEVEVLGTAFTVSTGEDADTVVLQRGSVAVDNRSNPASAATLAPGQMVSVTSGAVSEVSAVDVAARFAWLDGRIVFHDRPLAEVLVELQRYHGGPIFSLDAEAGRTLVSGNYQLDDPEGVVRSLAAAAGAEMTALPGGIIILR